MHTKKVNAADTLRFRWFEVFACSPPHWLVFDASALSSATPMLWGSVTFSQT